MKWSPYNFSQALGLGVVDKTGRSPSTSSLQPPQFIEGWTFDPNTNTYYGNDGQVINANIEPPPVTGGSNLAPSQSDQQQPFQWDYSQNPLAGLQGIDSNPFTGGQSDFSSNLPGSFDSPQTAQELPTISPFSQNGQGGFPFVDMSQTSQNLGGSDMQDFGGNMAFGQNFDSGLQSSPYGSMPTLDQELAGYNPLSGYNANIQDVGSNVATNENVNPTVDYSGYNYNPMMGEDVSPNFDPVAQLDRSTLSPSVDSELAGIYGNNGLTAPNYSDIYGNQSATNAFSGVTGSTDYPAGPDLSPYTQSANQELSSVYGNDPFNDPSSPLYANVGSTAGNIGYNANHGPGDMESANAANAAASFYNSLALGGLGGDTSGIHASGVNEKNQYPTATGVTFGSLAPKYQDFVTNYYSDAAKARPDFAAAGFYKVNDNTQIDPSIFYGNLPWNYPVTGGGGSFTQLGGAKHLI